MEAVTTKLFKRVLGWVTFLGQLGVAARRTYAMSSRVNLARLQPHLLVRSLEPHLVTLTAMPRSINLSPNGRSTDERFVLLSSVNP